MPAYYDEKTKTWFCKFYYTDYTGARKQKKKRGFPLKRDAQEWERTFLEKQHGSPDMTYQALYDIYIEEMGIGSDRALTIQKGLYLKTVSCPTSKRSL